MHLNCGVGEDTWESLGLQGDPTSTMLKEISPEYSLEGLILKLQYLATWCEEWTHRKRPWCWERLKVGKEGDDRGWDGWMASLIRWTWVWISSGSWWWTGTPGVLQCIGVANSTWLSDWTDWSSRLLWSSCSSLMMEKWIKRIHTCKRLVILWSDNNYIAKITENTVCILKKAATNLILLINKSVRYI